VILTFNSEASIASTLRAAFSISDDVNVVDSFSTDRTEAIVKVEGANFWRHEFVNYGAQRNWAITTLPLRGDWELHLDADERLSSELVCELHALTNESVEGVDGLLLPRVSFFLGRAIRHGGLCPTWHCRLFRRGKGHCENRLYDQHFYVEGRTRHLKASFFDDVRMPLSEWSARHVRWSVAEVDELLSPNKFGRIAGDWKGNAIERKRRLKGIYYRSPLFLRASLLLFYRYVLRGGFLDGTEGLIFFVLQTFWFRFLVDAELYARTRGPRCRSTAWPEAGDDAASRVPHCENSRSPGESGCRARRT
jgi:glycosyltransferase involved in cell wall biosynthesis